MEMCWQEADDRPSAEDILAFLQQIEEEVTSQSLEHPTAAPVVPVVRVSPQQTSPNFVMSKNKNQFSQHVAEVLVHRVDDSEKHGFDDDFNKDVTIRKNIHSHGFEDDFVAGSTLNDLDLPHNDSIIASGGNVTHENLDGDKDIFAADHNLNILQPPVPVRMSTPSKYAPNSSSRKPDNEPDSVAENQSNSKYTTTINGTGPSFEAAGTKSLNNPDYGRSDLMLSKLNNDEGYRTAENGSAPDSVTSQTESDQFTNSVSKFTDDYEDDSAEAISKLSPKLTDLETERAKQIYMSKGAGLPPSNIHKSRSLGTIPEDGIPSDNTSVSGVVFDDQEESEDVGMNFEWDDFEGEQLVGRVRYMSEDSTGSGCSNRSPRHVDVEEWPFDQDSGSESHSKAGSIASESDGEVTRLSIGSNTSIDTRARIASILTNRLNSLIKQTNSSQTTPSNAGPSMFYSFSEYDNDIDSPEHVSTDSDFSFNQASGDFDVHAGQSLPVLREEEEERETTDDEQTNHMHNQEQVIICINCICDL